MDKMLLTKIRELQGQGQPIALATIVDTKGSTPRKAGAAMVVERTGRIWGSVGGGCGEAAVRQHALQAMDEGRSLLCKVDMLGGGAADEGMICGGIMEVFVHVL